MKKSPGLGRPATDGAYVKNVNVTVAGQGTVYCVTGNAADLYTANLNHPAIAVAKHLYGTVVLDVSGNQLNLQMLSSTGTIEDSFTMIKAWGTVDTDGDGMPDDFENEYGFNPTLAPDANDDADADGLTDLQEFRAGTDPRDGSSKLASSLVPSGAAFVFRFNSVPGVVYRVDRCDDLADQVWTNLAIRTGTGAMISVTDSAPSPTGRRFYRVQTP